MSLEGGREGGRGGEGRGGEGRERGGRGGRGGMTVIHIILMAPYIQTNNEPFLWNQLPASVKSADSIGAFKTALKTHLFREAFMTLL